MRDFGALDGDWHLGASSSERWCRSSRAARAPATASTARVRLPVALVSWSRNRRRYGGYIVHIGDRDAVRRVRRDGRSRPRPKPHLRPGEIGNLARAPTGGRVHLHASRHLAIQRAEPPGRRPHSIDVRARRQAPSAACAPRSASMSTRSGDTTFRAVHRSRHHERLRDDLYVVLAGLVNGTEQAVSPLHHQSARLVGVVRGFVLVRRRPHRARGRVARRSR